MQFFVYCNFEILLKIEFIELLKWVKSNFAPLKVKLALPGPFYVQIFSPRGIVWHISRKPLLLSSQGKNVIAGNRCCLIANVDLSP